MMTRFVEIKMGVLITIVVFVFVPVSKMLPQSSSRFPQDKINKVCRENRDNRAVQTAQGQTSPEAFPPEINKQIIGGFPAEEVFQSAIEDLESFFQENGVLYIGPGSDTVRIESDFVQDGNIVIYGEGILVVDNAKLTLSGHLYAQDDGQAIFRNDAHLHFNQYYVGQYFVWLVGRAKFEATDAVIDANSVMHYVQIHDNSIYKAKNTRFPDWVFRKVFNTSSLILEDVDHVGDIMVDDSCFVHFTRCDTLMPWLEAPDGSVIDIRFPDPEFTEHFEFSAKQAGIDGIGYTFIVDSCSRCWWSLETLPGCNVTITNSTIRGSCVRMFGFDTISVSGIENNTYHSNLAVPLDDRQLNYVNTYVYWWNWYPYEDVIFNIDSCSFGEMIGRDNSVTHANNCVHDGATIMLGAGGNAFVSFTNGISYSFAGTFKNSTFLFVNSRITPLWPYQSTNIAHDNSYLLAVNSSFEYEPEAMDSALVMFTAIDSLSDNTVETTINISGSAWIDVGSLNHITFDSYKLYWSPAGASVWTLIEESDNQIRRDAIGVWNTAGLSAGEYDLRLTIRDSAGDSLTAFKTMTLQTGTGFAEEPVLPGNVCLLQNYPNPFNPHTTIGYILPTRAQVSMKIFDMWGREIRTLIDRTISAGHNSVMWDGKDDYGLPVSSGVYSCRLILDNTGSLTKTMLLLK